MSSHASDDRGIDPPPRRFEPAPYTSGYVEAGGLRLHYLDYGAAGLPPMLCVHGGAAHAHWFDFVASGFNTSYHVRALDLRGHGNSPWVDPPAYSYRRYAADVAEAAQNLGLRDFVLIGHSMGGMVSLLYAATYPGRVAKLVIVDTSMRMSEDRVARMRDMGARQGRSYASEAEFVERYRLFPTGGTAAPEVIAHIARNAGRQAEDGRWRLKFDRNIYATRETLDGLPHWAQIRIPALLVKGDRSPRISPEIFAIVKAHCPQIELAEVPHADHHVTLDNPAGFVQAVSAFLAKS